MSLRLLEGRKIHIFVKLTEGQTGMRLFMWWDLAPIDHLLEATVQTFIFPSQVLNKILLLGLDPLPTYLFLQTKNCNSTQTIAQRLDHSSLISQSPIADKNLLRFNQLCDIIFPPTSNPTCHKTSDLKDFFC